MGIKNLNKLLRHECPNEFVLTHLSHFAGKTVAVDMSLFIYKYIKSIGTDSNGNGGWLNAIISLMCCLKKNHIKILCVFDGQNIPIEKIKEREIRKDNNEKLINKSIQSKIIFDEFCTKYTNPIIPIPEEFKQSCLNISKEIMYAINNNDRDECFLILKNIKNKLDIQSTQVTKQHILMVEELVKILGISYLYADGEAEKLCVYLCNSGNTGGACSPNSLTLSSCASHVDAVLTEDTDVLAYKCNLFLSKINITQSTVVAIKFQNIIKSLDISDSEFLDMCIMCGCDYNHNVKGLGSITAFKLIKKYKNLEKIEQCESKYNLTPLNYKVCRELFSFNVRPLTKVSAVGSTAFGVNNFKSTVPYDNPIDFDGLEKFLSNHRCLISIKYIKQYWEPTKLIFDDEEK